VGTREAVADLALVRPGRARDGSAGSFGHGDGARGRGDRCRKVLKLPTAFERRVTRQLVTSADGVPSWCQTCPAHRVLSARAVTRKAHQFTRLDCLGPADLVPSRNS